MSKWTTNDIPDLTGKVVIVTGGNSGLGYESVKAMADKGAHVILASRSIENGEEAKSKIGPVKGTVEVMPLDLQDFDSISEFSETFLKNHDRLDILLNNAGIMTTPYFKTKEGLEGQIGTNHFGHFLLTSQLFGLLKNTDGSRIVNVSSNAHKFDKMNFDNLMFEEGQGYTPMKAYAQSKLANLLFTYELQRRVDEANLDIEVLAAHPGGAMTNLARHLEDKFFYKLLLPLANLVMQDAASGALPQLRASTDPNAKGGEYYGPNGFGEVKGAPKVVKSNARSHNKEDAAKLWEISEELTSTTFNV